MKIQPNKIKNVIIDKDPQNFDLQERKHKSVFERRNLQPSLTSNSQNLI